VAPAAEFAKTLTVVAGYDGYEGLRQPFEQAAKARVCDFQCPDLSAVHVFEVSRTQVYFKLEIPASGEDGLTSPYNVREPFIDIVDAVVVGGVGFDAVDEEEPRGSRLYLSDDLIDMLQGKILLRT